MKPKPTPKTEIAIVDIFHITRNIWFDATPDAAAEFAGFGMMTRPYNDYPYRYLLTVDVRYDFDEVVNWIQEYGQESSQ